MAYIGTAPTKVVSRQSVVDYRYTATAGQTVAIGAATKVVGSSMDGDRQRALVGEFLDEQSKKGN